MHSFFLHCAVSLWIIATVIIMIWSLRRTRSTVRAIPSPDASFLPEVPAPGPNCYDWFEGNLFGPTDCE